MLVFVCSLCNVGLSYQYFCQLLGLFYQYFPQKTGLVLSVVNVETGLVLSVVDCIFVSYVADDQNTSNHLGLLIEGGFKRCRFYTRPETQLVRRSRFLDTGAVAANGACRR
jgi:hypothetical protein